MITKGILKTIDYNENSCTVRLPLFETAASSGEVVLPAIFLTQPGSYNGYDEGDIVFVDFENNSLNNPVVIGKLYLGAAKEKSTLRKGGLTVADLNVTSGASIPLDTKLVFDKASSTTVSVDNGLDTYKSIIDIIKALHKTEISMDKVVDESLDNITNITVEYLSQLLEEETPTVDNPNWAIAIPTSKDGEAIWQKTTCYNRRGQILGIPEIICLSNAIAATSYRLKCSTRVHSGKQQATNIILQTTVKVGSELETRSEDDIIKYKWESDEDWTEAISYIPISANECKDEDLLVEAWRPNATVSYADETITFMPKGVPIISLSRDSASLSYDSKGINKLTLTETAVTTALVYFNNEIVTAIPDENFTWTISGGTATNLKGPTIEITDIDDDKDNAVAECTVIHNGITLTKTFTVTKVRKGGSTYKLDIENDYVSVITGSNGIISWDDKNWTENTKHILTVYYGDEIIKTNKIKIEDPKDDTNLYLKITTTSVTSDTLTTTEDKDHFVGTINELSILSDTGEIKYQLFEGLTLLASAKFEITRIRSGESAASYWLKLSANSHLGTEQSKNLSVTAMVKNGTNTEEPDEEAILWWRLPNIEEPRWGKASGETLNTITFTIEDFTKVIQNNSIEIIATHNSDFTPDADTNFLDPNIYEEEIIEYAPRNTPILTLTNDSDALSYNYLGQCLDLDSATTTAQVVLNSNNVTGATYNWTFTSIDNNGTRTSITNLDTADTKITKNNNTIVVHKIPSSKLDATCTATYTWDGQSSTMTKVFTVVRQLQGEASVSHWLKFDSFVHTGAAHKSTITVTAMKKIGADGAEENDDTATLYWRYKNDNGSWEEALDNTYILKLTPTFKADDIEIIATHDKTLVVDKDTTSDTEGIYEFETITYSPLNTPVIDLTNDSASLNYSADGKTKIGEACVESTASLWLNGEPLYASFEWDVSRFKQGKADQKRSENGPEFDTVYVYEISDNSDIYSAEATVTATVLAEGPFKGKTYTKNFRVTKSLKGDDGAAAVLYRAHASSEIIAWSGSTPTPSSIDVYLEKIEGNTITKVPTYISYSVNGGKFQKNDGSIDKSTTKYPYIQSGWGMAAVTSSLVLNFYLSSDDRAADTDNINMVDQITITAVHDGADAEVDPIIVQYAFLWSDSYLYDINSNLPLTNLTNTAASKETWFIRSLTDAPEIKETRKIIFISSRSGIESKISETPWSKPEMFAVANEKAYQILKTSEGLFGYGQGVYYTVDTTATFNNKTFTAGEKYTPEDLAAYAAESETNRNNIKVYINAEYIKTGALTVGNEVNPLFQAGLDDSIVKIGGWNVDTNKLYSGVDSKAITLQSANDIITNGVKYEILNYIQSDGVGNYIDTGITLDYSTGFTVEIDYAPTVSNQIYCLLSSYVGSNKKCLSLEVKEDKASFFGPTSDVHLSTNTVKINGQNKTTFSYSSGTATTTVNGVETKTTGLSASGKTGSTTNKNSTLKIFADYRDNTFNTFYTPLRLYALKIYSGSILVADFVPVKRASNGYLGIYDRVTDTVKLLSGTPTGVSDDEVKSIYLGSSNAEEAPFSVTNTGKLKATSGEIGGFKLTETEFKTLAKYADGNDRPIVLITNNNQTTATKVANKSSNNWRLLVGSYFGVDNEGKLYATEGNFEGTIIGKSGSLENMSTVTTEELLCNSNLVCNNISFGGSSATITTVTTENNISNKAISLKKSPEQSPPSYIGGSWLFSVRFDVVDGFTLAEKFNTEHKLVWATFSCTVSDSTGSGTINEKLYNKVYFNNATLIVYAERNYVTITTSAGGNGAPYNTRDWTLEELYITDSNGAAVSADDINNGFSVGTAKVHESTTQTNIKMNCGVEAPTMIAEAFYATSDKRLKENIKEYIPQKSILDLPVVEFDFKESGVHQIGCIAQDLQEICPELVTTNVDGYLTISENKLVYLLLEEIKKLNSKVIELEQTLKSERTK